MSATPGQKQKAYAHVLPEKVTRLAAAFRRAILSTTKAICERRFCVKMLRTLWYTDSVRKSEEEDEADPADLVVLVDAVSARSARAQNGDGDNLHSALSIIPAIPSKIAGRSVPDID